EQPRGVAAVLHRGTRRPQAMTQPRSPSALLVKCPNPACGKPLSVSSEAAGQAARCPRCNTPFRLPASAERGGTDAPAATTPPAPAAAQAAPEGKAGLPASIGPYQVSRELGRGAFGVVYQAFDSALKRDVAIKVLNR